MLLLRDAATKSGVWKILLGRVSISNLCNRMGVCSGGTEFRWTAVITTGCSDAYSIIVRQYWIVLLSFLLMYLKICKWYIPRLMM